ncbi:hypothetical protein M3Y99_00963100 [Aphelenchoides fujianensis]|nr:hypothetical protein M3Y99_00963100 [Aphelenchoides fujianensis]
MDKLAKAKTKAEFVALANRMLMGRPERQRRRTPAVHLEQEKEIQKINREVNAAKNTKCEQYLFCHCTQLEGHLRTVFAERKLENQLVLEDADVPKVFWKKKVISAVLDDEEVKRVEEFKTQFGFLVAVDGQTFKAMVQRNECEQFVQRAIALHAAECDEQVQMTLAVIGKHGVTDPKLNGLSLRLFESNRVQLRFCRDPLDFAYLLAQIHRALAKMERKIERGCGALHVDVEKGIRSGENLVEDWWSRMLNHVYRLPEECRRAILDVYPNPFRLMERLERTTPGEAMQHLAGHQKLYFLLTSEDGTEVIDRPNLG